MGKRKTITRKQGRVVFHTSNVVSAALCIITIGLLVATCLNAYFVNKQQAERIQDINRIIVQISNNGEYSTEETLEDIYHAYYNDIDQKATDTISVALTFFGSIFTLVTIVNTITAIRLPKHFEKSLLEIDERIVEVERNARESNNAVHYIDNLLSQKTTREKIDAITSVIEDYGDNSGEFYFARGFLYDDIKDFDSAKADYVRAKKAGGAEHTYHNSMGVLYSNIMDTVTDIEDKKRAFKKSEQHYKKAIRLLEMLDEKTDYCHCNLACLYQDYAKALKGWSNYKSRTDEHFNGEEYTKEFQKYSELALEEFNITISMSEDYLTAYYNRGISYREMGEDYYLNAYDDFQKCNKIDPENKDVWNVLFKTALALFQKTNNQKYYIVARKCINCLLEDYDEIMLLKQKFDAVNAPDSFNTNELLAKIDEKIADITVEEAELSDDPAEKGNKLSDALNNYNSALEIYKQLYATNKSDEYWKAVERLNNKISHIQKPEQ